MFSFRYTTPCEIKGIIYHRKDEHPKRLGPYTDIDGRQWDIRGLVSPGFKGGFAIACLLCDLHPYYTDTSTVSYGLVSQSWEPYKLEIVSE